MISALILTYHTLCILLLNEDIKTGDKKMFTLTWTINHKVSQVSGNLYTEALPQNLADCED